MKFNTDPIGRLFFALESETASQAVCSVLVLESLPDLALLGKKVALMAGQFPKLQRRYDKVRQTWEEIENFDLNYHFTVHELQGVDSEQDLVDAAASCFSRPLDFSKPLWKTDLFIAADKPLGAVFVFTIHHGLADGLAGFAFSSSLHSSTSELTENLMLSITEPLTSSQRQLNCGGDEFSITQSLLAWSKALFKGSLKTSINGVNSSQREFNFVDLDLRALRALSKQSGISFYELVLCITARAFANYFAERQEAVPYLRVVVPVSYRSLAEKYCVENRIAGIGFELDLQEADSNQLLAKVSSKFSNLKAEGALGAYLVAGNLAAMLPKVFRRWLARFQALRTNFIVTHLPASGRVRYLCGARVRSYYGLAALWPGHGLSLGFVNYAGKLCISVVTDPEIVGNGQYLARLLANSAKEVADNAKLNYKFAEELSKDIANGT